MKQKLSCSESLKKKEKENKRGIKIKLIFLDTTTKNIKGFAFCRLARTGERTWQAGKSKKDSARRLQQGC